MTTAMPVAPGSAQGPQVLPVPPQHARVTALVPPPRQGTIPLASTQGTLALQFDSAPPPPAPAPEVLERFATRFAHALVEVTAGDRGPQQLLRWTSEQVYDDLTRRAQARQRTSPPDRRVRRIRPQVRSVRVFRPGPACAEVSIHVRHGQRSQAIAARIDLVNGHWCCTAVQFG
ncbi:MAG TPA: Rv3235 family protein [Marmoricola sp.]|nr:Rv3235 family protein [Marmoricola sp.]